MQGHRPTPEPPPTGRISTTEDWLRSLLQDADAPDEPRWSGYTTTIEAWPGPVTLTLPIMDASAAVPPPRGWLHVVRNNRKNRKSPFAFELGNISRHFGHKGAEVVAHLNAALGIDGVAALQRFAEEKKLGAITDYQRRRPKVQFRGLLNTDPARDIVESYDLYLRVEVEDLRAFLAMCRLDFDQETP